MTTKNRKPRHPEAIAEIRALFAEVQQPLTREVIRALRKHFPMFKRDSDFLQLVSIRKAASLIPHTSIRKDGTQKTGRSHSYISSMMNAGFIPTHGSSTMFGSVLLWLAEHPGFNSHDWATKRVEEGIRKKTRKPLPRVPLIPSRSAAPARSA